MLKRGLTPTHELMADWILQNPGGTLRDMTAHFGYSASWLSQVMNSDMFKAFIREKLNGVHAHVLADIPTMLRGTAALAIERVNEVLQKTEDAKTIIDSFDSVMHRFGYAPSKAAAPGATINAGNVFFLNKDDMKQVKQTLVESHEVVLSAPAPAPVEKVVDGELLPAA